MALTLEQILTRIEREIQLNGSLSRTALMMKVSPQLLSAVLLRRREIGPKMLDALNLTRSVRRVITYEDRV